MVGLIPKPRSEISGDENNQHFGLELKFCLGFCLAALDKSQIFSKAVGQSRMEILGFRVETCTSMRYFLLYAQQSEGESEDEVAFSTELRERKPVWTDEDDDKIWYVQSFVRYHMTLHHCISKYVTILNIIHVCFTPYPVLIYQLTRDYVS